MESATIPDDDGDRLAELAELGIIEAPPDEHLDRITRAAAQYFGVPISLVTLVDRDRQVFKAKTGIAVVETGRDVSFCSHAIVADEPFIVDDTSTDRRFADNPLVTGEPHIRFYAGQPIKGPRGHRLGTLCIIDRQPRSLNDADLTMLQVFAEAAENRIAQIGRSHWFGSSAQLLAAATNAAGIGLWEWDVSEDRLTWDDKMYALYGIEATDFSGAYEAWVAGLHPDDVEEAKLTTQRALTGEVEYDTRFRVVWPGGDVHWIAARGTVNRDESGKPLSMLGLNWDVTAEKAMEAELAKTAVREATAALMAHVEAAISELPIVLYGRGLPDGGEPDRWLLGDAMRLVGVSRAGFKAGEDILGNVVPGDRAPSPSRTGGRVGTTISEQFRIRCPDGTEKWFQHVARIDRDARTQTGALLDIDFAKQLSLKSIESEKMEALGRLAGGVAQDFNSILGVIANFATLARDTAGASAGIQADLNQIIAATERAEHLTSQLLTVYQPSAGLHLTDLNQRVTALIEFLSTALGTAIELDVRPGEEPALVLIDPEELDRVIINLALNARDAMPAGGKLDIVVSRVDKQPDHPTPLARLRVSDSGVGMSPEAVRRVFEPFYTTKETGLGAGLGLSTCLGIITDAGGTICCDSVEGEGTTFTVDLPLLETNLPLPAGEGGAVAAEQPIALTGQTEPLARHGADLHASILIVEEDPALRASTQRILERDGLTVTGVATIEAAGQVLRDVAVDVVISDIRLPDGDGLDFVRELKRAHENLPVLLWTGQPTIDAATRAVHEGVAGFLIKPVAAVDLIRVVHDAVGQGRQRRLRNKLMASQLQGNEFLADLAGAEGALSGLARVEEAFDEALSSLQVHFQPIVHAGDSSVFGYEALLRCRGPLFASPVRFIAAAELVGRINDVGLAVRTAIAEVLAARPGQAPTIFVNLHPSEVHADLLTIATEPLLPFASQIVLEITERSALASDRQLNEDLHRLRDCGYRIAIDDLGEGYAGLTSLVRVNPDIVKIDMSLVTHIDRTPLKQDIVSAIAGLARPNGILVVAEGVETPAERATLRELGCDLLQGYLFAEAGPPFVAPRAGFAD